MTRKSLYVLPLLAILGSPLLRAADAPVSPVATLRVELQAHGPKKPIAGKLFLEPADPESTDLEAIEVTLGGQKSLSHTLPADSTWTVRLDVEGFWRPPSTITLGEAGSVADYVLPIWPAGEVTGRLVLAEGEADWSAGLQARVASAKTPATIPTIWTPCDLKTDGQFRCLLPAAKLDLTLKVPKLVPKHRFDLQVRPGQERQLGKLTMKVGASVGAFVDIEGGEPISEECKARLRPLQATRSLPQQRRGRDDTLLHELPVPPDGFVQFEGVAPGSYALEVEQPGFAVARRSPIEVWSEAETLLTKPITLFRPFALSLNIDPPQDLFGEAWTISLDRHPQAGGLPESIYSGKAGEDGRLVLPDQRPGRYQVIVSDALGNRLYANPEMVISGSSDASRTLSLELLTVEGKLTLADEPLGGSLWFDGKHGSNRVEMHADQDGLFEGYLPREGRWKVEIESPGNPPIETEVHTTVSPDSDGHAEVEIALPDTEIFGTVVDERDNPVSGAEVMLSSAVGSVQKRSEDDGSFEFRAAPEGPVQLTAVARGPQGRVTSLPLDALLIDGQPAGPFTLKLASTQTVTGRVLSPEGPVVGASLRIETVPNGLSDGKPQTTDPGGRFETNISAEATAVEIVVSAPGYALEAFRRPLDGGELVLNLSRGTEGSLDVLMPYSGEEAQRRGELFVLWQNGMVIASAVLARWATSHGVSFYQDGRLAVPSVAPGSYRICLATPEQLVAQATGSAQGQPGGCSEVTLAPGEALTVRLGQD